MEWWNDGMVECIFFSSILFACLPTILWLSFQFACFYFQAILLCVCRKSVSTALYTIRNKLRQQIATVLTRIHPKHVLSSVLAIAALK